MDKNRAHNTRRRLKNTVREMTIEMSAIDDQDENKMLYLNAT